MGKKRRRVEKGEEQRLDADFERRLTEAVKTVLANAARYKDAIAAALPSRRAPRAAGEQAAGTRAAPPPAAAAAPLQQPWPAPATAAAPAGPSARTEATAPAARADAARPAPAPALAAVAPGGGAAGVAGAAGGAAHTVRPAKRQARCKPQHAADAVAEAVSARQAVACGAAAAAGVTPVPAVPAPQHAAVPTLPPPAHDAAAAGPGPGATGAMTPAGPQRNARSSSAHRGRWQPDELQVLMRVVRAHPAGGEVANALAWKELGWIGLPDPQGRIRQRLYSKLSSLRAVLHHGVDPEQVVSTDRKPASRDNRLTWTAWVQQAFLTFPDNTGTADDVCAYLQANPDIAPLLDHRPSSQKRTMPRWRHSVCKAIVKVPGVTKTGEKRKGNVVYVCDPQGGLLQLNKRN